VFTFGLPISIARLRNVRIRNVYERRRSKWALKRGKKYEKNRAKAPGAERCNMYLLPFSLVSPG
jgi:hypothetical protein